jgi:hypothetical protein
MMENGQIPSHKDIKYLIVGKRIIMLFKYDPDRKVDISGVMLCKPT